MAGSTDWTAGMPKARVLPEPVRDWPMRSRPASRIGRLPAWIGVGVVMLTRRSAALVVARRSRSANDEIADVRTGAWVEGTKKLLSTRAEKRHDGERCQITGSRLEADHAAQSSPCCTL